MSAEISKKETSYGIRWADGTLELRADGGLWTTPDYDTAAGDANKHHYYLERAHIPKELWPKVVEFEVTTTFEEVEDA